MAKTNATNNPARGVLLVLFLGQLLSGDVQGAEGAEDPYDTLYDVLMTRYTRDGKSYAENETSPVIFFHSRFPFGDETYEKFSAALHAFAALPQEKVDAYSDVKRALLQRHLWKVFDATLPDRWKTTSITGEVRSGIRHRRHGDRRAELRPTIASLIRRLALTREEILALPNTLTATIKSGAYSQHPDPEDLRKPLFPADLDTGESYSKDSAWICLGAVLRPIPADVHSTKFKWRSAFLSFLRVPGGRTEALESIARFNRREEQPVGTQLALIEQAFLISDAGELVLSPLTVSVSLRAFVGVVPRERKETGRPRARQSVAEFVMQPRRLMEGDASMKALGPHEPRFEAGDNESIEGGSDDPFELARGSPGGPRLELCSGCHSGTPSRLGIKTSLPHYGRPRFLKEGDPDAIIRATSSRKRDDHTWKALHRLWQKHSAKTDLLSRAEDAYDELFDSIVLRRSVNGEVLGHDEFTPVLYGRSKFPFDPASFARFDAALKTFESLPQETIENYSDIQRALLQHRLWAVLDATRVRNPAPAESTPRIASLIRRLALPKKKILALPSTGLATVDSGEFPETPDPSDPFAPFLPADLFEEGGSWVGFGRSEHPRTQHAESKHRRSAFFQSVRTPGGREKTIASIDGFQRGEVFPVGTQFALIERAFLVSDEGRLVLSPLVFSIQLRAYLDVERSYDEASPSPTQSVTEFVLQPRELMKGNAVMRAFGRDETVWKSLISSDGEHSDPVARRETNLKPRMRECMDCHGRAGLRSLGGFLDHDSPNLTPLRRADIIEAARTDKGRDIRWATLQKFWHAVIRG